MDLSTIIGIIGGSILIVASIVMGGNVIGFIDLPSLLLVVGGTVAVTFIKFKMSDVINSLKVAMKAFTVKMSDPEELIEDMIHYSRIAKKEGLISLEKEEAKDPFCAKALRYLSDGYDEGLIGDMLSKDIRLTIRRHIVGQNVFRAMGESAPAFGMIGTLIGLVQMLSAMGEPSSIGPAMALALLTTLYGAVLANFLFLPIAEKLSLRSEQEKLNKSIIVEAAISINRGLAPIVLEESLRIFLTPDRRKVNFDKPATQSPQAGSEAH